MNKLSKWLPFKFKRKKQDEQSKKEEASAAPAPTSDPPAPRAMAQLFDPTLADRLWRNPLSMFDEMERFFGDFAPPSFQPRVDIIDEGTRICVTAELPGLDREDIEVTVEDGLLVLCGEKKSQSEVEEDGCYRVERYFGRFQRALPLPTDVDPNGAEASFDKGLLTIRLPKTSDGGSSHTIPIR